MKDYAPKLWLHAKPSTLTNFVLTVAVITITLGFFFLLIERLAK